MRSLIAALPLFLLGGAPQPPVGCRVLPIPAPYVEARTMAPAIEPPTTVHIDLCVCADEVLGYENRNPFSPGVAHFDNIATVYEVAFDAAFTQPLVLPVTLTTDNQSYSALPFDGVEDFGGSSGITTHNVSRVYVTVDLTVGDPSFFMSPWTFYVRVRPDSASFHAYGMGPLSLQRDTIAALGISATYQ